MEFLEVKPGGGICLLCRNYHDEVTNQHDSQVRRRTITALKMLLRFINVDVCTLLNLMPTLEETKTDLDMNLEVVMLSMCMECFRLCNTFGHLYQDFETVRLHLCECVESLRGRMGYSHIQDVMEDGDLKEKIIRKCSNRLSSTPKIFLQDIGGDPMPSIPTTRQQIQLTKPSIGHYIRKGKNEHVEVNPVFIKQESYYNEAVDDFEDEEPPPSFEPLSENEASASGGIMKTYSLWNKSENMVVTRPVQTSSRRRVLKCNLCGKIFTSTRSLQLHSRHHKRAEKSVTLTCTHCGHISNCPRLHQRHVLTAHVIECFSEDLPPTTTKQQLEQVLQLLLDACAKPSKNSLWFRCCFCSKRFRVKFEGRVHLLETHFDAVLEKLEHVKTELKIQGRPGNHHQVPTAATKTKRRRRNHDPKEIVIYNCEYCGQSTQYFQHHKSHIRSMHTLLHFGNRLPLGTKENELEDAIKKLLNLGGVINLGGGKKHFTCGLCTRSGNFYRRANVRHHILYQHFNKVLTALTGREMPYVQEEFEIIPVRQDDSDNNEQGVHQERIECAPDADSLLHSLQQYIGPGFLSQPTSSHNVVSDLENLLGELHQDEVIIDNGVGVANNEHDGETENHDHEDELQVTLDSLVAKSVETYLNQDEDPLAGDSLADTASGNDAPFKCSLCASEFALSSSITRHMRTIHTRHAFADELPPGTTDLNLNRAINEVISKYKRISSDPLVPHECGFCQLKSRSNGDFRTHILNMHFDKVVVQLNAFESFD